MIILEGKYVLLKPLEKIDIEGLVEASNENPSIYKFTNVPQNKETMTKYIEIALEGKRLGTAFPWTIIGKNDGQIKGTTRYWNVEKWEWPSGHSLDRNALFDVCEIGHTWLRYSAIQTAINTETKLLLLTNLFENWNALRVCFRTDARNQRSQTAIERIGGKFEGIIRADRMAVDYTIRDSYRYSILYSEWECVKNNLIKILQ